MSGPFHLILHFNHGHDSPIAHFTSREGLLAKLVLRRGLGKDREPLGVLHHFVRVQAGALATFCLCPLQYVFFGLVTPSFGGFLFFSAF